MRAHLAAALAQPREQVRDALEVQGCAPRAAAAAVAVRFSRTVKVGKIAAPSGTRPMPRRAMR